MTYNPYPDHPLSAKPDPIDKLSADRDAIAAPQAAAESAPRAPLSVTVGGGDVLGDPALRDELAAGILALQQAKGTAPGG